MPYSSSLTDSEWEIIEPILQNILPTKKRTRPSNWTKREILDGIFYQLKNGCNWQDLPKDLPPYSTIYWQLLKNTGSNRRADESITLPSTRTGQKKGKWTTLMLVDSQAVKNTCNASIESKGFCFYKSTNGIKRHLAVDTLGFPFFTHCTKANVSDDAGLIEMLSLNMDYFKSKPLDIPQITILLDNGYQE
jgi:transposase